jgi:hypothetical protein
MCWAACAALATAMASCRMLVGRAGRPAGRGRWCSIGRRRPLLFRSRRALLAARGLGASLFLPCLVQLAPAQLNRPAAASGVPPVRETDPRPVGKCETTCTCAPVGPAGTARYSASPIDVPPHCVLQEHVAVRAIIRRRRRRT